MSHRATCFADGWNGQFRLKLAFLFNSAEMRGHEDQLHRDEVLPLSHALHIRLRITTTGDTCHHWA